MTPKAYAAAVRARRLASRLGDPDVSVTEAVYDAGYGSSSRAYAAIEERLGMTATTYRKGGKGETVRHAVARSSLGLVLVAGTARGICAIEFGDTEDDLVAALRDRLPSAVLEPADAEFHIWLKTVLSFIETPEKGLDLPLDIRGTAFQQRVWAALRAIPPGTTVTYSELARKLGTPVGHARHRTCLRQQPHCRCHPLPPRRPHRRKPCRLPLGTGTQTRTS